MVSCDEQDSVIVCICIVLCTEHELNIMNVFPFKIFCNCIFAQMQRSNSKCVGTSIGHRTIRWYSILTKKLSLQHLMTHNLSAQHSVRSIVGIEMYVDVDLIRYKNVCRRRSHKRCHTFCWHRFFCRERPTPAGLQATTPFCRERFLPILNLSPQVTYTDTFFDAALSVVVQCSQNNLSVIFAFELSHHCKSVLPSAKGLSIYFHVTLFLL